ncbi:MAG: DsbA family protein [Gemmatimonadaceae bacterium]|nr:DsbA family protein [Gemmatimonadaceae bacterium]
MKDPLEKAMNFLLVLSAVAVATVLVRREFRSESVTSPRVSQERPLADSSFATAYAIGRKMGSPDAGLRLVVFSDLECPFCRSFHRLVAPMLRGDSAVISASFVHMPLSMHRFAYPAARAAECAARQASFSEFLDVAFDKQDSLGLKSFISFTEDAGIPDTAAFARCASEDAPVGTIEGGLALAKRLDVFATPTVMINGYRYPAPPDSAEFHRILSALRAKRPIFSH